MSALNDISHALQLVETALGHDTVHGVPAFDLIRATQFLRVAIDRLRPACSVCDDSGCPHCPKVDTAEASAPGTVIEFPRRTQLEVTA